jgi:HK97 family phage prohead protease
MQYDREQLETRAVSGLTVNEDTRTAYGYCSVYNVPSDPLENGIIEIVAPGAFDNSIKAHNVFCVKNHNLDHVLGDTQSGTLTLKSDDKGLYYEIPLLDLSYAQDIKTLLENKVGVKCSFGFQIIEKHTDDEGRRVLDEVDLYEITISTPFPAYPQTTLELRDNEYRKRQSQRLKIMDLILNKIVK